jgi:hypothetical protein
MKSIIIRVQLAILKPVLDLELSPIPDKRRGKLRLSPEQLLWVIHAQALAEWALSMTQQLRKPRLPRGPGGRPPSRLKRVIRRRLSSRIIMVTIRCGTCSLAGKLNHVFAYTDCPAERK